MALRSEGGKEMIFILIGKSCSGKTTLAKELEKWWGCKRIITYTTRPKRPNEIDGVDYHFVSEEYFKQKEDLGFFMATAEYEMTGGKVWYGSAKEDYEDGDGLTDKVIVLNPDGLNQVMARCDRKTMKHIKVVYLDTDASTRYERARKRGDSTKEIAKREDEDFDSFCAISLLCDIRIREDLYSTEDIAEWLMKYPKIKVKEE